MSAHTLPETNSIQPNSEIVMNEASFGTEEREEGEKTGISNEKYARMAEPNVCSSRKCDGFCVVCARPFLFFNLSDANARIIQWDIVCDTGATGTNVGNAKRRCILPNFVRTASLA